MTENAAQVNLLWRLAVDQADSDPADALAKLIDIQVLLEHHLEVEREDLLAATTEGAALLANLVETQEKA